MAVEKGQALRPREAEALAIWESLPSDTRTYEQVSEQMLKSDGSHVTGPRAAVYVRDAITKSGREDLLPARGRKVASGGGTAVSEEDEAPLSDIERLRAQFSERIKGHEQRLKDAAEALDSFDAVFSVTSEVERLQKVISDAEEALASFEGDAQTKWATQQEEVLASRKRQVESDVTKRLGVLRRKEQAIAKLLDFVGDNEELAELFSAKAADLAAEGISEDEDSGETEGEGDEPTPDAEPETETAA